MEKTTAKEILNINLKDLVKDTRSLTRLVNIVLGRKDKYSSKDLIFSYKNCKNNGKYISIHPKSKVHDKNDWTVYLGECDFSGITVKHLVGNNYNMIYSSYTTGKFIKSKKWVNQNKIDYKLRQIEKEIERLDADTRLLKTFCPY